jgi:hypothetical protein
MEMDQMIEENTASMILGPVKQQILAQIATLFAGAFRIAEGQGIKITCKKDSEISKLILHDEIGNTKVVFFR